MHRSGNPPHQSASIRPLRAVDPVRAFQQALAYHGQGRLREADQLYEIVLAVDKRHFDAVYRLGSMRLQQHRFDGAAPLFRRAIKIGKTSAEAHHQLGAALEGVGRLEEALRCDEKALAIKPDFAEARNNLGHALQMLGRLEEAVAAFETAIAARPAFGEAYYNLGNALHQLGRSEEAIAQYEKALAIRSNAADARIGLGNALQAVGRLGEAAHAFEQAIAASPKRAGPYFSLAKVKRLAADDRHFLAMRELARDLASLPVEEQTTLHFALGKALADVGDRQRSFRHLLDGNALKRRQIIYDEARTLKRFERIRAAFGAQLMREKAGLGDPSTAPVFIFGMARSGTTLVEQILASHPNIFGAGELTEMATLAMSMRGADGSEFPERVAALSGEDLRRLGASHLRAVRRMAPATERITDKLPANFDLAGLIHLALPNARMIHVRGDPRDTAVSCFSTLFTSGQEFTMTSPSWDATIAPTRR
jgi:tetratricopeptide (TPR) repeat protein